MFSGIVEEVGAVSDIISKDTSKTIHIKCKKVLEGVYAGDSISVNGVCLTVTDLNKEMFKADIVNETLLVTTLDGLSIGDNVNLERAMKYNQRVGGHLVQGHIDTKGRVAKINETDQWTEININIDDDSMKYCIHKGSIAIDGVSLTIAEIKNNNIKIALIPHTLNGTILSDYRVGQSVNIETDMHAKYIEKLHKD